jgi:hypothetical protein
MQFSESLKKSLPSDVKHSNTIANTKIWKEKVKYTKFIIYTVIEFN